MPHIDLPEGVPGIVAAFNFRPETAVPMRELAHILLHEPNSLAPGERELIAAYVSSRNRTTFCELSHGAAASAHLGDPSIVEQVKADFRTAPISPKLKALIAIAGKVQQDGKLVFLLTDRVWLTQKDVRQVQLAKGAIRAGVEFLLREAGVEAVSLAKVLIAGSFGFHLTARSLTTIGLLPPEIAGNIEFVGNTAKSGGEAFLLNRDARREMALLATGIEVLELANYPDFDRVFVKCLSF